MYNKVFLHLSQGRRDDKTSEKIADWLDVPLDKLPRDEVRKTLAGFDSHFDAWIWPRAATTATGSFP